MDEPLQGWEVTQTTNTPEETFGGDESAQNWIVAMAVQS